MTAVVDATHRLIDSFELPPGHGVGWVNALRKRGIDTFGRLGFPTARQEEWRDTNVAAIAQGRFRVAAAPSPAAARGLLGRISFGSEAAAELVFVNGHFAPELSRTTGLPGGVGAMSLERATRGAEGQLAAAHLGRYARLEHHPFAALNTGFLQDGAFVHIGRQVICEKPIHLIFLNIPGAESAAIHPRVLIVAEEESDSSIVETYVGDDEVYLTNAVTEIVQGPAARIDHNKVQLEGCAAHHIALMQVELATGGMFVSHSTSMGSRLTRNDLQVLLNGDGAEATLNGLVYARGHQHIDNHTLLHHEKPHCPSHELYKHVLADEATAVFKGKIFVQKDAQKTDSKQTSKSLLLSDKAFMNSQPTLEIYADDVKCTHGSTTGPIDENAVFYLVSRGLSLAQARHLMTYAFAADITRRIKVAPVRTLIEDFMAAQHGLPRDLRITEEAAHNVALL